MVTPAQANVKDKIDNLRQVIGREIAFHIPTRVACSICTAGGFYDALSDASTYIRCPLCKGKFWLNQTTVTNVLARVHWTTNEVADITPGGKFFIGDAYAHIEPTYHALAQAAQEPGGYVVVDGQEMTITRINPEGVPEINRYKLILTGKGLRPTA